MKRTITGIFTLIILFGVVFFAGKTNPAGAAEIRHSGTCGDALTWTLDSDGTLTVSGSGTMPDYDIKNDRDARNVYYTSAPWGEYRREIKKVVIENGVENVSLYAFYGCTDLKTAMISEKVTKVGLGAFSDCTSLSEMTYPGKLRIEIPEAVSKITLTGTEVCDGCLSNVKADLQTVILKDGIKKIGRLAFSSSTELTSITIPDSVTKIDELAFNSCSALKVIHLPDSVIEMGDSVFQSCRSLETVNIPAGVTEIGEWTFYYCEALKNITIPENIVLIERYAFYGCSGLESITIPESVTEIYGGVFTNCTALTEMTFPGNLDIGDIPDSVTKVTLTGTEVCENCFYNSGSNFKTVVLKDGIKKLGDNAFYGCTTMTSIDLPESLIEIGDSAFEDCNSLNSITLPESIKSIGYEAFCGCSGIKSITIPKNAEEVDHTAFADCTALTEMTLPGELKINIPGSVLKVTLTGAEVCEECFSNNIYGQKNNIAAVVLEDSIKKIGSHAFDNCTGLTSINIPDGVTAIGEGAFFGCVSLTSISIPDSVTAIGKDAFYGCGSLTSISIPGSVRTIGANAFTNCDALTSVSISYGVISIGENAFDGCGALKSVRLPDSVTDMGGFVFYNCPSLENVNIPCGMTGIPEYTFYGCESLKSVTIPEKIASFGRRAFSGSGLKSVTIPQNVTDISEDAFLDCSALTELKFSGKLKMIVPETVTKVTLTGTEVCEDCLSSRYQTDKLASVVLEDGIKKIGANAFCYRDALTSIIIPKSVKEISEGAFSHCVSLTSVNIPDGVTKIGRDAFSGCTSLTSVTIPKGVKEIAENTFADCASMTSVSIPDSVTTIGDGAFKYCKSLTSILLPEGVASVGENALMECSSLTGMTFPGRLKMRIPEAVAKVTLTGTEVCRECLSDYNESIKTVILKDGIKKIGTNAFSGCFALKTVTVPDSVEYIGLQDNGVVVLKRTRKTLTYNYSKIPSGKKNKVDISVSDRLDDDIAPNGKSVTMTDRSGAIYCLTGIFGSKAALIKKDTGKTVYFTLKGFNCGAAVIGDDNDLYILWAKNSTDEEFASAPKTENVKVIKYSLAGKKLGECGFPIGRTYSMYPYDAGNAALAYNNGTLIVLWNTLWHGQYSNDGLHHQGLEEALIKTSDMSVISLEPNTGSHSFGVSVIPTDTGFAYVQINDVLRGINITGMELAGENGYDRVNARAYSSPGQYGTNSHKLDGNSCYVYYPCCAQSKTTYAVAGSGVKEYTENVFKESKYYKTANNNVFVRILDSSLGADNASDCAGETRKNSDNGKAVDKNIIWLTSYGKDSKRYIGSVKILTLDSGAYCVLWSEHDDESYSTDLCYVLLDEKGNILRGVTRIEGLAVDRYNTMPATVGDSVIWSSGVNENEIVWITLNLNTFADNSVGTIEKSYSDSGSWSYDGQSRLLTVSGSFQSKYGSSEYPWYFLNSLISSVKITGKSIKLDGAFEDYPKLKTVIFENGVTDIGENIFGYGCSLNAVYIPKSVKSIGAYAFGSYDPVKNVYYQGSKSDWQKIKFGYGNGSLSSSSSAMHYNSFLAFIADCTVTLSAESFRYNGKVQQPSVTVKNAAGKVLAKDKDYTVSYSSGCKAVGTYTVTVKGAGSYSGSVKKSFAIRAATSVSGDVNGDGKLTAADARLALRQSVGLEKYKKGSLEFTAADVDKNGKIEASDARLILRASVGLEAIN